MKSRMRVHNPLIVRSLVTVATLLPFSGSLDADADELLWTNPAGGSFQTPGNWSLQRVPGSNDVAILSSPGIVQPFTITLNQAAATRQLQVQRGAPTINLGGRTYTVGEQFRVNGLNGAQLRITNGVFSCAGFTSVGIDQSGTLVLDGVIANTATWNGVGGGNTPSVGEMSVVGSSTRFNKTSCCDSNIGHLPGNTGRLYIMDQAEVHWGQGFFAVGRDGGTGELSITGAGLLSIDPGTAAVGTGHGPSSPSVGTATIAGAGSLLQVSNMLLVGHSGGSGNLLVSGGGQAIVTHCDVGSAGGTGEMRILAGSGVSISGGTRIGDSSGTGTLIVSGAGALFTSGNLGVGYGATGNVHVESGGRVSSVRGEFGGYGGLGFGDIRGAGSRWDVSSEFVVGSGAGSVMTVADGGIAAGPKVVIRERGMLDVVNGGRIVCGQLFGNTQGTMSIEVSPLGLAPIEVSGPAVLAGQLIVPGTSLEQGQTRTLLSAGSISGQFSSMSVPAHHVVTVTATLVRITRVPPDGGDCDGNGIPDSLDLEEMPWRDFDRNGTLDACEGRTYWIGGSSGDLSSASNWSGGLPGGAVPAMFATGGPVTVASSGGTFPSGLVVRSGSVALACSAPLSVASLSIEGGGSLSVSGELSVAGDATVLPSGRLGLDYTGWLSVGGRLDCRAQSALGLGLRLSGDAFVTAGSGSFLGGIDVGLGSVSPWTVEPGTRFTLVSTGSLESDGFFASLFAAGLGPNLLGVAGPGGDSLKGIESLVVEVTPLSSLIEPQPGGSTPVTGLPTALETARLTADAFDDVAVTVSFGPEANGLLYVIESDGTGGFVAAQGTYPTGRDPRGVRSGYFDETDFTRDLAVTSAASATLQGFRNLTQGVGGFAAGPPASTFPGPGPLGVVDSPATSSLLPPAGSKVVVASGGGNNVQGFVASGPATFVPGNTVGTRPPRGVSPMPGTSRPSLEVPVIGSVAVATEPGEGESLGRVLVVDVDANGVLSIAGEALGPPSPADVESRDLNADGFADVTVASSDGSMTVLRGTAAGLASSGNFAAGSIGVKDSALGDFDGDGLPDLATALFGEEGSSGSLVRLFRNESVAGGAPTFQPAGDFARGKGVRLLERAKSTAEPNDSLVTVSDEVPGGFLQGGDAVVTLIRFATPKYVPCTGDINLDGVVDGADLTFVLTGWGTPGLGDLTGDGTTDAADLSLLLAGWGPCG